MKKGAVVVVVLLVAVLAAVFYPRFTGMTVTSINTCYDTDQGKEFGKKGEVWGDYYLYGKEEYHEEDYCVNDKKLVEYYCVGSELEFNRMRESMTYRCQDGCENGECVGEGIQTSPSSGEVEENHEGFWIKLRRMFLGI
ncbi:MAG: hypothetical protein ABIH92_03985 [Nanoarchaeota archaeon]